MAHKHSLADQNYIRLPLEGSIVTSPSPFGREFLWISAFVQSAVTRFEPFTCFEQPTGKQARSARHPVLAIEDEGPGEKLTPSLPDPIACFDQGSGPVSKFFSRCSDQLETGPLHSM
jgi:hypothetical protein